MNGPAERPHRIASRIGFVGQECQDEEAAGTKGCGHGPERRGEIAEMDQGRSAGRGVKPRGTGAEELQEFDLVQRGIVAPSRGDLQQRRQEIDAHETAGDRPYQGAEPT